jgi:hypothetical protein
MHTFFDKTISTIILCVSYFISFFITFYVFVCRCKHTKNPVKIIFADTSMFGFYDVKADFVRCFFGLLTKTGISVFY